MNLHAARALPEVVSDTVVDCGGWSCGCLRLQGLSILDFGQWVCGLQLELKRSVQINQDPAIQSVDLKNWPIEPVIRNMADQPARALGWPLTENHASRH